MEHYLRYSRLKILVRKTKLKRMTQVAFEQFWDSCDCVRGHECMYSTLSFLHVINSNFTSTQIIIKLYYENGNNTNLHILFYIITLCIKTHREFIDGGNGGCHSILVNERAEPYLAACHVSEKQRKYSPKNP